MDYSSLRLFIDNHILTVTINRPEKLNALNATVFTELDHVLDDVYVNPDIQSVIITGAGEKAFVAGADIAEFSHYTEEDAKKLAQRGLDVFFKIERAPKPIVACVNGFALGGGCELAMACHFRIASVNAQFGQPEVNLGLIPGYGGTQRLTQLIGKGRAMELLMSGQMIQAETALQYGLVNHVTPAEGLLEKAKSILSIIHKKAPMAISNCIKAANDAYTDYGYETETNAFAACFKTEDFKEGSTAFIEKRKPVFTGK
ncbi:MAG: enoyl-CoA hydratase/isomerase family protein [Bacteroidetes bacterium]|nr:enoyl-CoA hydratase/isomerase family protein [Bacteroidota bacterium]